MQIKHTFLLTFVLGLVWTGYVFAYALGPDPAMNAVFNASQTCAAAGCHTGNPLNAAGGSLTIEGIPAQWTAGQTYPLSITIARTGARLFGFQLSAVTDAGTVQAGTLTPGHARVMIICGRGNAAQATLQVACSTPGAIQYAEHSNATVTFSTYLVNWTAPSDPNTGRIRFNLAGNAANGNAQNTGDFIYTRVDFSDPAPPVDLTTRAFTMVDRGGVSLITDGGGGLSVGYSRIQPNAGSTTPSGVAIFGLRQNNVIVTEAGVPASPLLTTARIYAEVAGVVNTGLAIANPNPGPATIQFNFTNQAGVDVGAGTLVLDANKQIARFLNEDPFNVPGGVFQGTFSLTSDQPISIIALRGFTNERSEFLITTLPVTNLAAAPGTGPVFLPHFAEGSGWTTQIVLVNPTSGAIGGSVQFVSGAGAPLSITANGQAATSFNYTIPARSSFKLATAGIGALLSGSVRVTPSGGAVAPSSLVVFSYKPAGITVSEAGVPGIQGAAFRMYAEETALGGIGAIQTGIAIANAGAGAATVTLELTNLDGAAVGAAATVTVAGNGQNAGFLHDFFPGLSLPFKGLLRISMASAAGLSVVGLRGRYNERSDFLITTTPPNNETNPASAAELLFPHLVNGDGYTTQFILFSGTAGQASSGNLKFFKQDGTGLNLIVN